MKKNIQARGKNYTIFIVDLNTTEKVIAASIEQALLSVSTQTLFNILGTKNFPEITLNIKSKASYPDYFGKEKYYIIANFLPCKVDVSFMVTAE